LFYGIFALILFSLILIAVEYQSRYSWLFLMMVAGMVVSLFAMLMYLAKFGNYDHISHKLFPLDYRVFLLLSSTVKLPVSTLARVMNAGIALYLLAVPLFIYDFTHDSDFNRKRIAALLGLILYITWFYDPSHAYRMYINYHLTTRPALYAGAMAYLHTFNQLLLIWYLSYPVYILTKYMRRNTVRFIKRQILLLAGCLAITGSLFFIILNTGPFMMSPRSAFSTGFWIFGAVEVVSGGYFIAIPIATVCALFCILLLLFNFRLESLIQTFTDRKIQRNLRRMNELLSDTLHSQKNMLFNIYVLTEPDGQRSPEEAVAKIRELADQSLRRTSEMLDSLRAIRYVFKTNDLVAVIEESVGKLSPPARIGIALNKPVRPQEPLRFCFDHYHISRVLVELLTNAVEAVELAGRQRGTIEIDIAKQFQWVFIIVQDNGAGIPRASLKRLTVPYYSEKGGGRNWGLGLSYAYKVVKAHLGHLRIESKQGEGTMVQIMLPYRVVA